MTRKWFSMTINAPRPFTYWSYAEDARHAQLNGQALGIAPVSDVQQPYNVPPVEPLEWIDTSMLLNELNRRGLGVSLASNEALIRLIENGE